MPKLSKETFDLYMTYNYKYVYCPKCNESVSLHFVDEINSTPIILICDNCRTPVVDIEEKNDQNS